MASLPLAMRVNTFVRSMRDLLPYKEVAHKPYNYINQNGDNGYTHSMSDMIAISVQQSCPRMVMSLFLSGLEYMVSISSTMYWCSSTVVSSKSILDS